MIRNHSRHGSRFPITLGGGGGYSVAKSLRFQSSASAYLSRTPATATSQTTWTWSAWVKRGILGTYPELFTAGVRTSPNPEFTITFEADALRCYPYNGSSAVFDVKSTALYRDPAAWYHVIVAFDTTQATASDRVKFYVNGQQITSFVTASYPTQNSTWPINSTTPHQISGSTYAAGQFFDGELAEVNFVDGQALAPTSFGAFSIYNQWLPIKYAGTYGTNGFYLPFNSVSTSSYAGSFNGSTQYLSANLVTAVGTGDFTIELWYYPLSGDRGIYQSSTTSGGFFAGNTNTIALFIGSINNLGVYASGTTTYGGNSKLLYNAWTHIALVRVSGVTKVYMNGVLDTSFAGGGLADTTNYTGAYSVIGGYYSTSYLSNGYISNFRLVKGTAVYTANFTPSVVPLTAITNTQLLTLQNATIVDNSTNAFTITNNGTVVTSVQYPFTLAIAADSSGNANNWTANNISLTAGSTYDSLTDVPTLTSTTVANYAVLNPLGNINGAQATLSNGNLTATSSGNAWWNSTIAIPPTGKFYCEYTPASVTNTPYLGLAAPSGNNSSYISDGRIFINGSLVTTVATYTSGDVIACAYDTAGTVTFYKNNTSVYSGSCAYQANLFFYGFVSSATVSVNFGQQPFTYTPPTGFLPLNAFNITAGTVTTSGTFTGNASTDGPMVWLNGTPTAMTINGNAVVFGTQADKLANGFKVRSSSASYNTAGSNTYVATTVGAVFKYEDAQGNP